MIRSHGLMLVRNEADILPESIAHYLTWLDGLYVFDLGSTDGTWELLNRMARSERRLVLHDSRPILFQEGLRALLFEKYRSNFNDGDWIIKADADEFYDIPARVFQERYLRPIESCVYLQWLYFRLTSIEVAQYESGAVSIADDRRRSIADRRRYYKLPDHAEPRMFRYRHSMQWSEKHAFPYNAGYVARARIPVRHYPHRDPEQMASRYRLRSLMKRVDDHSGGAHWQLSDWTRDVVHVDPHTGMATEHNDQVGLGAVAAHTDGPLHYWGANDVLRCSGFPTSHLGAPWMRAVQRAIYAGPVHVLDWFRSGVSPQFEPHPAPEV